MPGPRADRQAAAALRRDIRLAAAHRRVIDRAFRSELRAVTAAARDGDDPATAVTAERWTDTLGEMWVSVGRTVYPETVDRLSGDSKTANQQLVALVQQIVRRGAPATQVALFVDELAQGIITTSRRRIHTVLRELEPGTPSQVRDVTRALSRLYRTDFVGDRAARIALDQALRASATFEDAAARQVAVSTGREYVKVWTTQQDDRVRSEHSQVHGDRAALDDVFKVDGYPLRYPRDPAGPAYLTVNCRCWVEHVRL